MNWNTQIQLWQAVFGLLSAIIVVLLAGVRTIRKPVQDECKRLNEDLKAELDRRIGLKPNQSVEQALDGIGDRINMITEVRIPVVQNLANENKGKLDVLERESRAGIDRVTALILATKEDIMKALQGPNSISDRMTRVEAQQGLINDKFRTMT